MDTAKIEQLVDRCLNTKYALPWYRPNNIQSLPWDELVESFEAGYIFALDAVLRALRGDGGKRLQKTLNKEIIIIRPADRAEYEAKIQQGLIPIHFSSLKEAEDFLDCLATYFASAMPSEWSN